MAVVGVDTGGTFTDIICRTGQGFAVVKLLSTPDDPARAILEGLARLSLTPARVMHGSTVATNALLERRGAATAFVALCSSSSRPSPRWHVCAGAVTASIWQPMAR